MEEVGKEGSEIEADGMQHEVETKDWERHRHYGMLSDVPSA